MRKLARALGAFQGAPRRRSRAPVMRGDAQKAHVPYVRGAVPAGQKTRELRLKLRI
jgi:hypothetical protein